jgi:hypothetical protein
MRGLTLLFICLFATCAVSLAADEADPIKERLDKARSDYTAQVAGLREELLKALKEREDQARKTGDLKTVERVKSERDVFESRAQVPTVINADWYIRNQKTARSAFTGELQLAAKNYLAAKKDEAAAAAQKELDKLVSESDEVSTHPFRKGSVWKGSLQVDDNEERDA